jgi:hypothetical protein
MLLLGHPRFVSAGTLSALLSNLSVLPSITALTANNAVLPLYSL